MLLLLLLLLLLPLLADGAEAASAARFLGLSEAADSFEEEEALAADGFVTAFSAAGPAAVFKGAAAFEIVGFEEDESAGAFAAGFVGAGEALAAFGGADEAFAAFGSCSADETAAALGGADEASAAFGAAAFFGSTAAGAAWAAGGASGFDESTSKSAMSSSMSSMLAAAAAAEAVELSARPRIKPGMATEELDKHYKNYKTVAAQDKILARGTSFS